MANLINGTAVAAKLDKGARETSLPTPAAKSRLLSSAQCRHILVPLRLHEDDGPLLIMALQMAAAYHASVTFLHVRPRPVERHPYHWLNAIEALHEALDRGHGNRSTVVALVEETRQSLRSFVDRRAPAYLLQSVQVEVECRLGDVAEEIVRFAGGQDVDLVMLQCRRKRWGLPIWSEVVRRVFRCTGKGVVICAASECTPPLEIEEMPTIE